MPFIGDNAIHYRHTMSFRNAKRNARLKRILFRILILDVYPIIIYFRPRLKFVYSEIVGFKIMHVFYKFYSMNKVGLFLQKPR